MISEAHIPSRILHSPQRLSSNLCGPPLASWLLSKPSPFFTLISEITFYIIIKNSLFLFCVFRQVINWNCNKLRDKTMTIKSYHESKKLKTSRKLSYISTTPRSSDVKAGNGRMGRTEIQAWEPHLYKQRVLVDLLSDGNTLWSELPCNNGSTNSTVAPVWSVFTNCKVFYVGALTLKA